MILVPFETLPLTFATVKLKRNLDSNKLLFKYDPKCLLIIREKNEFRTICVWLYSYSRYLILCTKNTILLHCNKLDFDDFIVLFWTWDFQLTVPISPGINGWQAQMKYKWPISNEIHYVRKSKSLLTDHRLY